MAATRPDSLVGAALPGFALPSVLALEHPTGRMEVRVGIPAGSNQPAVYVMRTCRRLFEGAVLARPRR
jgi:2-methylaconitate cis-trans-isomerase PrpF